MSEIHFSFDKEMRELFEYPDPSIPFVFWIGDFRSFANQSLSYHWHNEFEYCVVLFGIVVFTIEGKCIELKQGDAIFINANSMHMATQTGKSNAKIFTVSFLPTLFVGGERGTIYRKNFQPILQSAVKSFLIEQKIAEGDDIVKLLFELYDIHTKRLDDFEMLCISLISRIWSLTLCYIKKHKNTLLSLNIDHESEQKAKDILEFIHKHYAKDIRIEDIVRYTNISRSGCFRHFQQYTNKSPMVYLMEYRLSRAVYLMMRTDKSITQIATECGFSNSSYFGKIFKKKYEMTPLQYKQSFSTFEE